MGVLMSRSRALQPHPSAQTMSPQRGRCVYCINLHINSAWDCMTTALLWIFIMLYNHVRNREKQSIQVDLGGREIVQLK